mgnify:CR=1 FL=1
MNGGGGGGGCARARCRGMAPACRVPRPWHAHAMAGALRARGAGRGRAAGMPAAKKLKKMFCSIHRRMYLRALLGLPPADDSQGLQGAHAAAQHTHSAAPGRISAW